MGTMIGAHMLQMIVWFVNWQIIDSIGFAGGKLFRYLTQSGGLRDANINSLIRNPCHHIGPPSGKWIDRVLSI